ncbi:ABC transporter permease [Nocardioides sp. zg-536]|uniref:Transport permease protein n=1 Tax=Nocardioides faecalis TaxID=2803858 RepID=A0A939BZD4_9ACTN|nr:ABC transporter permease [Nocardioides faecalis]MBM9460930.1 ABC transporter permease [Nocardioides faecalis]QVI59245.1 ABC transporter permease [Nocardioides faecalis]
MSPVTEARHLRPRRERGPGGLAAVGQSLSLARRGLLLIRHDPQRLFDVLLLPIVATVMFAGVFGGAVAGSMQAYLPQLVPGVLAQIAVAASVVTGVQLRDDMDRGVFDRLRTLPISRVAPLAGSLLADVVRYVIAGAMTLAVGVALGYRPENWPRLLAGCLLVVFCAFAMSWIFAYLGVVLRSAQAVQGTSMLVLMPLSFLSNALVPPQSMPGWMEVIAEVNPLSHLVTSLRNLAAGEPAGQDVALTLLGAGVILAVAAPLTVRAYVRQAR